MHRETFETLSCGEEKLVAQLAAQGLPTREIAQKLSVSERAVQEDLNTIYTKLRLSNRAQLVLYSVVHGLPSESCALLSRNFVSRSW